MPTKGNCVLEGFYHGMLLGFGAPHKPLLLVGREHGQTIPLADIDRFTAALTPNTDGNRIAYCCLGKGSHYLGRSGNTAGC
jgi:hypothetical protein